MPSAHDIFADKWPRVEHIIRIRARKWRLRETDTEDIMQLAALKLWRECLKGAGAKIDCDLIARDAWWRFGSQRRGCNRTKPVLASIDVPNRHDVPIAQELPAREPAARMGHGLTYTMADLAMDEPDVADLLVNGHVGPTERGRQVGATRAAVNASPHRYGGVLMPDGRWRYPAKVG